MAGDAPKLVVIAGPNGAGKSTVMDLCQRELRLFSPDIPILNPDYVALPLAGHHRQLIDIPIAHIARNAVAEATQHFLEAGKSVGFETNFSHPSKLDTMREAKKRGYKVILIYVGLSSPTLAEQRVERRVKEGFHNVPRDKIEPRYHGGLLRLSEGIPIANATVIFDNSANRHELSRVPPEIFRFYGAETVRVMRPDIPPYLTEWLERHFPRITVER